LTEQTAFEEASRVEPQPDSHVPETDVRATAVIGPSGRAIPDTHFIVMETSKLRPDVLSQSIQAVCPMTCYRAGGWPPSHPRGTDPNGVDVEERFKDALHLPTGMLTVCRERMDEALRLFTEAPGVVNLASAVYVSVHQAEQVVAIEVVQALLASGLDEEKLHIVCCADGMATDVSSFGELQAFLHDNPQLSVRVHAKAIPACGVLAQITCTPASIGDLLHGTQGFAQDVEQGRRNGIRGQTYKALDGLFLQYRLAALRPALLDSLEGLTPAHLTAKHWYGRIYADPLFLSKRAEWDGKPVGFDTFL
jgi:hypothetical protein